MRGYGYERIRARVEHATFPALPLVMVRVLPALLTHWLEARPGVRGK